MGVFRVVNMHKKVFFIMKMALVHIVLCDAAKTSDHNDRVDPTGTGFTNHTHDIDTHDIEMGPLEQAQENQENEPEEADQNDVSLDISGFIPPEPVGDTPVSKTCCGFASQYVYQNCLECFYPWSKPFAWVVGGVGVCADIVLLSLTAGIASSYISEDANDKTIAWICVVASFVSLAAKAEIMFNTALISRMKKEIEKNYISLQQSQPFLKGYIENYFERFLKTKKKYYEAQHLDRLEIKAKIDGQRRTMRSILQHIHTT